METMKEAVTDWAQHANKNAGWIVALGVATIVAGVLAIIAPLAGGLAITMLVGAAMAVGGVTRLVGAFHAGSFGQGAIALIGGVLAVVAGLILLARPGVGLQILTLMLGAYLVADGVFSAVVAFHVRPKQGWGWMLFSAAVSVLLGFLLLAEWPLSGVWAIGTLIGINLLFTGFAMISIGSAAKRMTKSTT
jgi:uncharacterized membrane protein HdeD (DUF308 family)